MNHLEIYIDGASKGNPGHSGVGVVVYRDAIAAGSDQFNR